MKKSLSLLLAIALVFGMFATSAVAAEAELTLQQKFDALKEAGIFNGYPPNGDPGFERDMTRAEFAKVAVLLLGEEQNAAANKFADVPAGHWAAGYIGAASEAGLVNGVGLNKFAPNGKVTAEQVAKILASAVGLEEASATVGGIQSDWAKGWVAAAVQAGLIPEQENWKANAKRSLLVSAAYTVHAQVSVKVVSSKVIDEKTVEVTFSDNEKETVTLETALEAGKATTIQVTHKGVSYPVVVTLEANTINAAQTGNREITVTFNRALTATEKAAVTFELKHGLITYNVTPKWADDSKSVVLTSNYLPANEYDLTVKGFPVQKVKIEDEKPAKIEITATSLQKASGQDLGIKLLNQFNKEIPNPTLNVNVYNATKGLFIAQNVGPSVKYDLSNDANAKVDDNIVVTVTHSSGLSATKTYKVVAGSAATSIKLGSVSPLKDKTRITAGDKGIVIPVELTDQYGTKIKLTETSSTTVPANGTFVISGITFMVSPSDALSAYAVDKDGVLTVDTNKAGTVVVNAVNAATGATGTTSFKIEGSSVVKTLQLQNPGVLVVSDEEVKIPFTAVDQFGGTVAAKDIVIDQTAPVADNAVNFTTNVAFAAGYPKFNGKGELLIKFAPVANDMFAHVYAYVNGAQVGSLQLEVKKVATPVKINGIKDVQTYMAKGASVDFDQDNITYIDNYNRTHNVAAGAYTVTSSNPAAVTATGGQLTAVEVGKAEITVNFSSGGNDSTAYKFTVEVVKDDQITSYSIKTIGTLYGKDSHTSASAHAKTVELVGKLSNGTEVAIVQANAFDFVTTSEPTKVGVGGASNKVIYGLDEGKSVIAAYKGSTKLAEQEVTVSEAAPIAAKVSFNEGEYTLTDGNAATFVVNGGTTHKITVEDQYGVQIAASGFLTASDAKVATVSGLTVTAVDPGQTTLTYITSNGITGTATLIVNP